MQIEKSLSNDSFLSYLNSKLEENVLNILEKMNNELDLVVFSGVIRDFALKHEGELRDLDLVVLRNFNNIEKIIKDFDEVYFIKNSFGGYKLQINDTIIDIWDIKDTWAFKNQKVEISMFLEHDLPNSCFFNFSSIVFDMKRGEFIESKKFNKFLKTKVLDIVLEDNPYPELCIVNTFYYQDKYHLKISKSLKKYLEKNFSKISKISFDNIQQKHFKEILYSHKDLEFRINKLSQV